MEKTKVEIFPYTFEISKETARNINRARRAIAETDKAKMSDWERRQQAQELNPNVATLQISGVVNLTVPIRCDILAKWTAAHDADLFQMEVSEALSVTVKHGWSSIKLLAPSFPAGVLPIKANEFNGHDCELVPDFDVATACLTAKTLRARKVEAKKEGERIRTERVETRQREEYEQALALLTKANIQRAAKTARSLCKLKRWARRSAPIIDSLPNPLALDSIRELDPVLSPEILPEYADKWLKYIGAKKRFETYAPKSYYSASKERPRREQTMNQAKSYAKQVLLDGVLAHLSGFGLTMHSYGAEICLGYAYESFAARIITAKETVRNYSAPLSIAA